MAGGRQIPGWVQWVLTFLGGAPWPEADEDAGRRVAEYHRHDQKAAEAFVEELGRELEALAEAINGQAHDAIAASLKKYIDDARLVGEHHGKLASASDDFATNVEYTKEMIIGSLIALAIQLGTELALEWCSLGTSTLAAAGSIAITRAAIMAFFRELVTKAGMKALGKLFLQGVKIGAREGAMSAGIGAGLDIVIQEQQALDGHRKGVDWEQTRKIAMAGAAGGAVGGLAGRGAGHGMAAALGEHAATTGGKVATGAVSGMTGGVAGAAAGAVAENGAGALADGKSWYAGAGLAGAMGAGAGFRGRPHVEASGGAGTEAGAPKPTNGRPPEHESANATEPKVETTVSGDHEQPKNPERQERAQPSITDAPHEAPQQHGQQAVPVAETRAAAPEAKPAVEQQHRAAAVSDQARGSTLGTDRPAQPVNGQSPAGGVAGERAATAVSPVGPRSLDSAGLSASGADRPVPGAAAALRDAPAVKPAESVAAKPGEPVKAFAGTAEPVERHASPVEAKSTGETVRAGEAGAAIEHRGGGEGSTTLATTRSHLPDAHGVIGGDHPIHDTLPSPVERLGGQLPEHLRPLFDGHEPVHEGGRPTKTEHERLAAMWDRLNEPEKHDFLKRNPMAADHLRLPVEECHERTLRAATELRDQLQSRWREVGLTAGQREHLRVLGNVIKAVEPHPNQPRRYLLGFEHDGRNIISIGNPDTAKRTFVFVPGTFSGHHALNPRKDPITAKGRAQALADPRLTGHELLRDVPGYAKFSERFWHSIKDKAGHEDVAVVCWQNYHAPQDLASLRHGAPNKRFAKAAAEPLQAHIERLQATNLRPDSVLVLGGHSYGNAPVGQAAKSRRGWFGRGPERGGVAADGILALSAPGMDVRHAGELVLKSQQQPTHDARVWPVIHERDILIATCKLGMSVGNIGHNTMPHFPEQFGGQEPHMITRQDADHGWLDFDGHRTPFTDPRARDHIGDVIANQVQRIDHSDYNRAPAHTPGYEHNPELHDDLASIIETDQLKGRLEYSRPTGSNSDRAVVVLPEQEHHTKTDQLIQELQRKGYAVKGDSLGWDEESKFRLIALEGPDRQQVSLEVSTRRGLDAEPQRRQLLDQAKQARDPRRREELEKLAAEVYNSAQEPERKAE